MAPLEDDADRVAACIEPLFPRFLVALYLAKSKPPEATVRGRNPPSHINCLQIHFTPDHLTTIRSYIRDGKRPEKDSNGGRYIDTLEFWKDSHHQLQNEANEQRARIFRLERELDAYKDAESQVQSGQKRKTPAPDAAANPRGKKRKRASVNASELGAGGRNTTEPSGSILTDVQDDSVPKIRDPGLPDAIFALQKSLLASPAEPATSASQIQFIISMIRKQALPTELPSPTSNSSNSLLRPSLAAHLPETLLITAAFSNNDDPFSPANARIFLPLIFSAIDKLGQTHMHLGFTYQDQLIYAITKLMKDILDQICHLAASSPISNPDNSKLTFPTTTKRPRRSKRVTRKTNTPCLPPPSSPDQTISSSHKEITHLSNFLTSTIHTLHPTTRPTDRAIAEGWLFFLLQCITAILKSFVFGEDDELWEIVCTTTYDTVVQPPTQNSENCKLRDEERARKERQAPWLINLLERSLQCLDKNEKDGGQMGSRNTLHRNGVERDRGRTPLYKKLRIQLQETIFTHLFPRTQLIEFKHALPKPHDPGIDPESWTGVGEMDVADKFKAEVWRLVGWERLREWIECDVDERTEGGE
ncbi:MAG: hypothetical protein Q9166_000593 [cf. Caloplaca sp. 2 TL-2023]